MTTLTIERTSSQFELLKIPNLEELLAEKELERKLKSKKRITVRDLIGRMKDQDDEKFFTSLKEIRCWDEDNGDTKD
jgi:hypothetical protein